MHWRIQVSSKLPAFSSQQLNSRYLVASPFLQHLLVFWLKIIASWPANLRYLQRTFKSPPYDQTYPLYSITYLIDFVHGQIAGVSGSSLPQFLGLYPRRWFGDTPNRYSRGCSRTFLLEMTFHGFGISGATRKGSLSLIFGLVYHLLQLHFPISKTQQRLSPQQGHQHLFRPFVIMPLDNDPGYLIFCVSLSDSLTSTFQPRAWCIVLRMFFYLLNCVPIGHVFRFLCFVRYICWTSSFERFDAYDLLLLLSYLHMSSSSGKPIQLFWRDVLSPPA